MLPLQKLQVFKRQIFTESPPPPPRKKKHVCDAEIFFWEQNFFPTDRHFRMLYETTIFFCPVLDK